MFTNNEEIEATAAPHRRVGFSRPAVGGLKSALQRRGLGIALLALLAAPNAALADNECNDPGDNPSDNGPLPDAYVCDDPIGTYTSGVTYDSDGHLSVESTVDNNEFGGNGIRLTGNGIDDVSFSSAVDIEGRDLTGWLLDIDTDTGNIDIDAERVGADAHNAGNVAGAIRAVSSGDGNIDIVTTDQVRARFGASPDDTVGIEARSAGGDIAIRTENTVNANGTGVIAETAGAGAVTLELDRITADVTGIHAIAGTGGISINISDTVQGMDTMLIAETPGTAEIFVTDGNFGNDPSGTLANRSYASGHLDLTGVAGGAHFRVSGDALFFADGADFGDGDDLFVLEESSSSRNSPIFGVSGVHELGEASVVNFGAGNDRFVVSGDLAAATEVRGDYLDGTLIDFGVGNDVFELSGRFLAQNSELVFGDGDDRMEVSGTFSVDHGTEGGVTEITGLETFEHTGLIILGPLRGRRDVFERVPVAGWETSDGDGNDVLRMQGTTFTGGDGGRVLADVTFEGAVTQAGCETVGAADCLDLRDGSTAGTTLLTLASASPDAELGGYNPDGMTVVDVSGSGTTAAEHFALDPASDNYVDDALYGPAIERNGLFRYVLQYDADNQQHVVVGLPRAEVLEYAALGSAVHSVWHMTSEAITDRRNDLRVDQEGAVWMRATTDHARRDLTNRLESYGQTYAMDHGYKLDAEALIGGMDLITGHNGYVDYVVGGQIGYTRSQMVLETGTSAKLSGAVVGVYGSLWSDRFFIDGTVNTNFLALDNKSPLGRTTTRLESLGVHVEGGVRIGLPENFYAEPLTTLSYVNTGFEEISVNGGIIQPDDTKSTRSAFGLRLGREWSGETLNGRYFITGRAWNVHDGGGDGVVNNPGVDVTYSDDFSGSFTQVEAGLNLHNEADTVSGYVSLGSKSKDDYRSNNLSAGVRLRW